MAFKRLNTLDEVKALVTRINESGVMTLVIDTETTSPEPTKCDLIDIQVEDGKDVAIFNGSLGNPLCDLSNSIDFIAHNYKFDAHVLKRHAIDFTNRLWRDTLLISHLLNENRQSYALDSYLEELSLPNHKEKFWSQYKTYQEALEEARTEYACQDIVVTRLLYEKLMAEYKTQRLPESLIIHVHRLQKALLQTEIEGIKIDFPYLMEKGFELKTKIDAAVPKMKELVSNEIHLIEMRLWNKALEKRLTSKGRANVKKPEFSFDSSKQLQTLLYECLHLPHQLNEKTKRLSTDDKSLNNLAGQHPLVDLLREYRGDTKVYGAYIEGTAIRTIANRIYPEFRVNGTVTGRLSHRNPNLAQLPRSGGVRGIYIPSQNYVFISADYSQLEVCIEANLTEDENLIRIFRNGESKHDITARELGISRDIAKTLNFAMQYHCTHYKVASLLDVNEKEGKKVWNAYWQLYKGPKALKDFTDNEINAGRSLVNLYGRRRRFEVKDRNAFDKAYRQGYNFIVQGTGADITNEAFYQISEKLKKEGVGRGLFTVHDEILIEVKEDQAQLAESYLLDEMVAVGLRLGLKIPLKAESSGPTKRWED